MFIKNVKTCIRKLRVVLRELVFNIKYYSTFDKFDLSVKEANAILKSFSAPPNTTAIKQYKSNDVTDDLTIIIPAYNCSAWIEECLNSVISQQIEYTFKVLVVNDGSTDDTGNILQKYASIPNIIIIEQENKGYSGARNAGIDKAHGHFLMFLDSDDKLLPQSINRLLQTAYETGADIVEGNGIKFSGEKTLGKIKDNDSRLWGGPVLKVINSELFSRVQFPENYLYEDKIIGSLILPRSHKTVIINDMVYAYRIHEDSITQKHDSNAKRLDSYWIMWLMQENQNELGISSDYENYIRAMRQIIMTYRRTVCFPEEIKRCIFIGSRDFLLTYYSRYLDSRDECYLLAKAIKDNQYGKYKQFCACRMI